MTIENYLKLAYEAKDGIITSLDTLIKQMESDIRMNQAKNAGNTILTATRAANRLLKRMKKEPREILRYSWKDEDNMQCFVDGHIGFRLKPKYHLPLEELPKGKGLEPIDMKKLINTSLNNTKCNLPSVNDLKSFISIEKAKKGSFAYDLGYLMPVVDARLLLDVIEIMDAKEIYVNDVISKRTVNALYVINHKGTAIMLPIRHIDKQKEITNYISQPDKTKARLNYRQLVQHYELQFRDDETFGLSLDEFERLVILHTKAYE